MKAGLKLLRHLLLWLGLPLLLLALLLSLLLFTRPGVRLAADVAMGALPQLRIEDLDGTIAHGLRASRVVWRDGSGVQIELQGLATVWDPACLLRTTFCVESLAAGTLRIEVPPGGEEPPSDDDTGFQPLPLPLLVLPWHLQLRQLYLAEIRIVLPERTLLIGPVSLTARWIGSRVTVEQLHAAMADPWLGRADARLSGTLDMAAEWPLDLALAGSYTPPLQDWQEQQLKLTGQGNLRHLQLDGALNAKLRLPGLEPLALAADVVTGSLDSRATLHRLEGEYRGAPLKVQGGLAFSHVGDLTLDDILAQWGGNQIQLTGQLRDQWDVQGSLALAQPDLLAPDARGRLDGKLQVTGPRDDPRVSVTGTSAELSLPALKLRELALDASINPVSLNRLQATLTAKGLDVDGQSLRDLDLRLSGDAASHELTARARLDQQGFDTRIQGSLNPDSFDWTGTVSRLQVQLDRDWNLRLQQPAAVRWQQAEQRLRVARSCLVDERSRACFSLDQQIAAQRGDATLDLESFDLTRLQPWLQDQLRLDGQLNSSLRLSGSWFDPSVQGDLSLSSLNVRPAKGEAQGIRNAAVTARFNGRQASVDTRFDLPPELHAQSAAPWQVGWGKGSVRLQRGCWQVSRLQGADRVGDLCLTAEHSARQGLKGNLDADVDLAQALQPWLPEGFAVQGNLTAAADLSLRGRDLRANLDMRSQGGSLLLDSGNGTAPVTLPYQDLHWQASLAQEQLDTRLELLSGKLGNGQVQARIAVMQPDPTIDLTGSLEALRLEVLRPLFPRLETFAGQVSAEARVTGTLGAPRIHGEARLQDMRAQSPALPQGIDDLDALLVFSGDRAELTGQLASGDGGADLGGQLALTDAGWRGEFNLHGRKLSLRQSEDFILYYQPDLTLQIEPDRMHLIGTLVLQKGFIWIKELPEGSVGTSDDVVFVDETGAPETTRSSHAVTADIMVSVQDKLRLRGFGGDVRLNGQVRVQQDATGVATGRGTIDIVEGSYTGFGQQLKIRKGQIIFSGPLDQPYISLEAIREVDTVVAGLRVSGPASEPIATLFSEPAMADSEVLYYIVTGKEPGTGTKEDNTLVQNTLLSMSLMGDRPRMRNLASKVGIEDLQMGTAGTGESTEVLVSGYLSPRTYLQYGISLFEPVNTLTVRYELRDNLFLEAVSGLASALDLLYSFEF